VRMKKCCIKFDKIWPFIAKGHFLIGDGIADRIFGHSSSLSRFQEMGRARHPKF
jgi:hypothetical protein